MSLTRPNPFLSKWAEKGKRFDVPNSGADTINGKADIQTGFPEITMQSILNGGVPPWGQDHNGILHRITQDLQWTQAGGFPVFDATLCDKIGGYPLGAELRSIKYSYVSYVNMIEGNFANPDDGVNVDSYWNGSRLGNGWAIKTILSNDPDNISYLDGDLRIVTKVAGAKSEVYVRPSYDGNNLIGSDKGNVPFLNFGSAIAAVPDGGTAIIHIYCNDLFSLNANNSQNVVKDLGQGLGIGSRKLTFQPYGQWYFSLIAWGAFAAINFYALCRIVRGIEKNHVLSS